MLTVSSTSLITIFLVAQLNWLLFSKNWCKKLILFKWSNQVGDLFQHPSPPYNRLVEQKQIPLILLFIIVYYLYYRARTHTQHNSLQFVHIFNIQYNHLLCSWSNHFIIILYYYNYYYYSQINFSSCSVIQCSLLCTVFFSLINCCEGKLKK